MTSIWTSFVHVLVTDGPFFISPAGSDQLHQDLDGHGPNLWQEVGGLDVRKLVNLVQQLEQVIPSKYDGKSDEKYEEKIFIIFNSFWLGFQILQFFKVIYLGPCTSNWQKGVNLWS